MKIDSLPNQELRNIANSVDNGDKNLDKTELNVFLNKASKALSNREISLEKYNQIWSVLGVVETEHKQTEKNTKYANLTNKDIHLRILYNERYMQEYKQHIDEKDLDYSFYNTKSGALISHVISKGVICSIFSFVAACGAAKLKNIHNINTDKSFKVFAFVSAASFLTSITAKFIEYIKGKFVEKSEEKRNAVFDFYKQQLEKLQQENKEMESELVYRANYT